MRLLADRFLINGNDPVIDLATGASVVIIEAAAGSAPEQLQWTLRCDRWRTLQHRAIAPLLDFGLSGERDRFEAWQCGPAWDGAVSEAESVCAVAAQFIGAAGLSIGTNVARAIYHGPTGALIVPDTGTGYPNGSNEPIDDVLPIETRGLRLIPRPACAALAEMAELRDGCRSRIAVLWGPAGSGRATVVRELARIARLNGLVPITSRLLDAPYADLWRGRSLFIMAVDASSAWTAALRSTLRSPRPHVVLIVSNCEQRGVDAVRLAPVEAEALASAVVPRSEDPEHLRRIRRAAVRARGLPGRFAQLLWHRFDYERSAQVSVNLGRGLRVAESTVAYGEASAAEPSDGAVMPRLWPAAGEIATLRRRVEAAQLLIDRGRHGPGLRQLRQAVGGLARRDEWSSAADGALLVTSCLLQRGRPRDAHAALDEARDYAVRARREPLLLDVGILSGEAWIDLARLDEAETVLAAAATTARGLGDRSRIAATAIALARCLYWRGRYAEASSALVEAGDGGTSSHALRADLLATRIALGRGQLDRATSLANQALSTARENDQARSIATASYCAGLVHLAVGDLDAAGRDVIDAIGAARRGRDPLRVARVRIMQAELERRRGRRGAAVAQLERVGRVARTLPPLLRARVDLLRVVVEEADRAHAAERVSRLVAATGLGALAVYAGDPRAAESAGDPIDSLAGEVIAIVRACQTAADEAVVLKDVCERVRHQIHAAAVAFIAGPLQRYAVLSSAGPRIDAAIAERAVTAGITIAPHRHEDRIEAAVPVQYGGAPIGALCARWTLGSTDDIRRASATLEMAAAAAAPIVSAYLGRRDVAARASHDLIGMTEPMADLRRAVERAAAAPFPVLIEGESGSGKELVARAVHRLGVRRDRTFCSLNCAALPDDLVEAELFGHARGAFTGAIAERAGVFEEAHGGTLFLDEIGELSPRAQAKVLRVIQEGELRRVGENLPRRVDVRIIAATNRDLRQEVERGTFRTDLWYRLDVIRVAVPPLRDRREDILVLAEHFWREACQRIGGKATLASATLAALARYDWPGNVRELQNVMAALAVRSPRRGVVPPTALPPQFGSRDGDGDDAWRFDDARQAFEERFVRAALVRSGGHRGRAAVELGVTRQGLTKLMARLGISGEDDGSV
jgi:DNA-binding NtrC family response regulator/tetratricopeptide (TPR) repeat protein